MRENRSILANLDSGDNFLKKYISRTYPQISEVFGNQAIDYVVLSNITATINLEHDIPESLSNLEITYPNIANMFVLNPENYFQTLRDIFTKENLNTRENQEFIDGAQLEIDEICTIALKKEEEQKLTGIVFLYRSLKLKRLLSLPENAGRDPSQPLRSFCPVANAAEEIIRYIRSEKMT